MPKKSFYLLRQCLRLSVALLSSTSLPLVAGTLTVPASDEDGRYTISWSVSGDSSRLEERLSTSSSWQSLSTYKSGSIALTRGTGTYHYRLYSCAANRYTGSHNCTLDVSDKNTIVAVEPSSPLQGEGNILPPTGEEQVIRYKYDALGRLTYVDDRVNGQREYEYDKAGNRVAVSVHESGAQLAAPRGLSVTSALVNGAGGFSSSWSAAPGADFYLVLCAGATYKIEAHQGELAFTNRSRPTSVRACDNFGCSQAALF